MDLNKTFFFRSSIVARTQKINYYLFPYGLRFLQEKTSFITQMTTASRARPSAGLVSLSVCLQSTRELTTTTARCYQKRRTRALRLSVSWMSPVSIRKDIWQVSTRNKLHLHLLHVHTQLCHIVADIKHWFR